MARFDVEVTDPMSKKKTYRLKGTAASVQVDRQESYDDVFSWDNVCAPMHDSSTTNITLEDVRLGDDKESYKDYTLIWRDDALDTKVVAQKMQVKQAFGDTVVNFYSDDEIVASFYTRDLRGVLVD